MEREISRSSEHFIICGAARVGRSVARELARKPVPFVIVDNDEDKLKRYSVENWLVLTGDSTQEKVLREAGIEKARSLVAATTTDAINIYIILTARNLNPRLKSIARASEEEAEKHLLTAGTDSVVSPAMSRQLPLEIEEVQVRTGSRMVGKTLEGAPIRQEMGAIVLAIKVEDSHVSFRPPPDAVIRVGDHLIAMGELNGLRRLEDSATKPA